MLYALISPALLFGQLNSSTITVTASRDPSYQPEQVGYSLAVESRITQGLDEVLRALTPVGITAANLATLRLSSAPIAGTPTLNWGFALSVPIPKIQNTNSALTSLQRSIALTNSGLSLSFYMGGSSTQAPSPCDPATLIPDAKEQAEEIARAANVTVGQTLGIDGAGSCTLTMTFATTPILMNAGPKLITVSSSQNERLPLDQLRANLTVTSGASATLEDVARTLAAAGVSGGSFTRLESFADRTSNSGSLAWDFELSGPLAKATEMLARLTEARQRMTSGFALTFTVGLDVSPREKGACRVGDLLAAAKAQGSKLAAAAGVTAGPIVTIRQEQVPVIYASFSVFPFAIYSAPSCGLTVQFQLL